jgi:hypothetical protein
MYGRRDLNEEIPYKHEGMKKLELLNSTSRRLPSFRNKPFSVGELHYDRSGQITLIFYLSVTSEQLELKSKK